MIEEDAMEGLKTPQQRKDDHTVLLLNRHQTEFAKYVILRDTLSFTEKDRVFKLLDKYSDVLTDVPGSTNLGEHHIHTTTNERIKAILFQMQ